MKNNKKILTAILILGLLLVINTPAFAIEMVAYPAEEILGVESLRIKEVVIAPKEINKYENQAFDISVVIENNGNTPILMPRAKIMIKQDEPFQRFTLGYLTPTQNLLQPGETTKVTAKDITAEMAFRWIRGFEEDKREVTLIIEAIGGSGSSCGVVYDEKEVYAYLKNPSSEQYKNANLFVEEIQIEEIKDIHQPFNIKVKVSNKGNAPSAGIKLKASWLQPTRTYPQVYNSGEYSGYLMLIPGESETITFQGYLNEFIPYSSEGKIPITVEVLEYKENVLNFDFGYTFAYYSI